MFLSKISTKVPGETTWGHWVKPADPRCGRSLQPTHMHCSNLQRSPIAFSTRPDFLMSPPPTWHISLSPSFWCRRVLERKSQPVLVENRKSSQASMLRLSETTTHWPNKLLTCRECWGVVSVAKKHSEDACENEPSIFNKTGFPFFHDGCTFLSGTTTKATFDPSVPGLRIF